MFHQIIVYKTIKTNHKKKTTKKNEEEAYTVSVVLYFAKPLKKFLEIKLSKKRDTGNNRMAKIKYRRRENHLAIALHSTSSLVQASAYSPSLCVCVCVRVCVVESTSLILGANHATHRIYSQWPYYDRTVAKHSSSG